MESALTAIEPHGFADARLVLSQCWVYTPSRGLRAMTLHGNGSSLAVDGVRLARWCILDDAVPRSIVAYLYSAEQPTTELREHLVEMARSRFSVPAIHPARVPTLEATDPSL